MTTDFGLAYLDPLKPSFVLVFRWHLPYLRIPHTTLASPIKIHSTLGPPTSGPEAPGYLLLEPKSQTLGSGVSIGLEQSGNPNQHLGSGSA